MLILGLLGMYFDAAVVFVTSQTLLLRLAPVPFCLSFTFFHQILKTILALQLTTFTKSFSAYITNVGSFTSVEPGVYYHFVSLREGLMTKLTRVGSGICEY